MKRNFDKKKLVKKNDIQPGDLVRVKDDKGKFKDPVKVTEVTKKGVVLGKAGKWPMSKISTKYYRIGILKVSCP